MALRRIAVVLFFIVFCVSFSSSSAQAKSFILPKQWGQDKLYVLVESDTYMISVDVEPNTTVSLKMSSPGITFTPDTLFFNATYYHSTFKLIANEDGIFDITFTVDGNDKDAYFVPSASIVVWKRSITFPDIPFLTKGVQSDELLVELSHPPQNGLTISASGSNFTIVPNTFTITAPSVSAVFKLIPLETQTLTIDWSVSGNDAGLYDYTNYTDFNVDNLGSIHMPEYPTDLEAYNHSTPLVAYIDSPPPTQVTVELSGPDMYFEPSTLVFGPNTTVVSFRYSSPTATPKSISYFGGGTDEDDFDTVVGGASTVVNKRIFMTQAPTVDVYVNTSFPVSIWTLARLGANQSVTVTPYGANLMFTPTHLIFTPDVTANTFNVTATALGSSTIHFLVAASPAQAFVSEIPHVSITAKKRGFVGVNSYRTTTLNCWVGVHTPKLSITIDSPPSSHVIATPISTNAIFYPPHLEFTPDQQTVEFTAVFTKPALNQPVSFVLSGPEANSYAPPAAFVVNVGKRQIQVYPQVGGTSGILYAGRTHGPFTITLSHAPEHNVSITPVAPSLTFDPPTLFFSTDKHYATFNIITKHATTTTIDYVVGGVDGGLYNQPTPAKVTVSLRSFKVSKVDVVKLGQWEEIVLEANVAADDAVHVHPQSTLLVFNHSAITFDRYTTYGGLAAYGAAAGVHRVWFELSGPEAQYYARPADINVEITQPTQYTPSRPFSSAAYLAPFVVTVALSVLTALVL